MTAMRLVRSQVIAVKSTDYVAAARAMGASNLRILTRHILPNAVAPVLVYSTITVGVLIAAEATLTYLGVGLQRPAISWGLQISTGQSLLRTAPAPGALPEHHPVPDRDGVHHAGRRPARRPRPEAAFVSTQQRFHLLLAGAGRLRRRHRPRARGRRPARGVPHAVRRRQRGQRHQLHRRPGRDPGDPRRVGLGQVGLGAGDHGHPGRPARGDHRRRHPLPGPRHPRR